jgi:hypothetical protein
MPRVWQFVTISPIRESMLPTRNGKTPTETSLDGVCARASADVRSVARIDARMGEADALGNPQGRQPQRTENARAFRHADVIGGGLSTSRRRA